MMTNRIAKNNALKALQNTVETDQIEEHPLDKNCPLEDNVENVVSNEKPFTVPIITQNAPIGKTLDLAKQYKRKGEHCDRDLIKIHNKAINKKDQGSQNKGLVYIDFQAGMFEALKMNFMNCIENDFEIDNKPIAAPKIELYGQAEERICLDLSMKVNDTNHDGRSGIP